MSIPKLSFFLLFLAIFNYNRSALKKCVFENCKSLEYVPLSSTHALCFYIPVSEAMKEAIFCKNPQIGALIFVSFFSSLLLIKI